MSDAANIPHTCDARQAELWRAFLSDRSTANRKRLADGYVGLVATVARQMARRLPFRAAELMADGTVGLLQAIDAFDPGHGVRFHSYASHRIRGAILDGLRSDDWIPRLERQRAARGQVRLRRKHSLAKVVVRSDGEDITLGDILTAKDAGTAEIDNADSIDRLLRGLPRRYRLMLKLHLQADFDQCEIAPVLGLTPSRVSQMMTDAMRLVYAKLRPAAAPPVGQCTAARL